MDPPNQPPVPTRAPDPVINILHSCPSCSHALSDLRVHEGSGGTGRGKLIQPCKNCRTTQYHTPAYVYSDACHLLVRITARQF
ncbi:hypothetical protein B0H13DRAFT_2657725, partial [Mycena leptocephala]